MSKKKISQCQHPKDKHKIKSSWKINTYNKVDVVCTLCNMHRWESRYPGGKIETSIWYVPKDR